MALMTVSEVAEFLAVQEVRVERLERESLLLSHHSYQYKTVGGESANDPIGERA